MTTTTLVDVIRDLGHTLKREGQVYKTRCPFHDDDTPSLSVDPHKGLWHCFGCGEGGDGITFLERSLKLSFGEAADKWRELTGEEPRHSSGQKKGQSMIAKPKTNGAHRQPLLVLTSEDTKLLGRLQDIYAKELATNEKALSYLKKRGITDSETIRAFGLGYVSGTCLPELSSEQQSRLQTLGALNLKGNESLYGCIVCPLYNEQGLVVNFWGRRILPGPAPHRALAGPRRGFIHRQATAQDSVVLVEGFLDALACYQAGVRNAIPIGGAAQVDQQLLKRLHREAVTRVYLALDSDEAGDEGAKLWAQALQRRGIGSVRVRLDFDPAEFFRQGGTALTFRDCAAQGDVLAEPADESEFLLDSHGLLYRVRSCGRHTEDKLKVQILVTREERSHRDILNLYSHKARKIFANACCARQTVEGAYQVSSEDIEEDLLAIIEGLEVRTRQRNESREAAKGVTPMSPEEREQAEQFLKEPNLVDRLQADMEALGYVGEAEAKLLVYLIATSRKLPRPLSGIVGSGSGAGKSFLVELAEQLTPPEEVELFSKLSSQALYYLPKDYLCRKLLILEERAGGEGADYAIRTLQTKDKLTQAVVLKDPNTGRMSTRHYEVEGPIAYLETTTQGDLNPENTSRCFEIPLDESSEQTRRIHQHQRRARSLSGLAQVVERDLVRRKHHNAQRLLESVRVVIPYAEQLVFPDRYLRTRRDHERFLSLIEVVAFLHQFQRVLRTANHKGREVKFIEATVDDYAVAYRLALRVLWVSLDELSRWGRELVDYIRNLAEEVARDLDCKIIDINWTRRQLREKLGWPDKRLRGCLEELVSLEYLQILGGGKGKTFVYRLNPNFDHNPRALGLLTPEQLEEKIATTDHPPNSKLQTSRLRPKEVL